MMVGAKADQRTQRRKQQRQREHASDDPGGHRKLDNHHTI
jgi:hypothetical protein